MYVDQKLAAVVTGSTRKTLSYNKSWWAGRMGRFWLTPLYAVDITVTASVGVGRPGQEAGPVARDRRSGQRPGQQENKKG